MGNPLVQNTPMLGISQVWDKSEQNVQPLNICNLLEIWHIYIS